MQGQISGILIFKDFIQRFGQDQGNGEKAFDPTISSLLVSLMSIGTLIGALAGAYTADWFGRRRNLSIGVLIFVIGNIIQVTAMNTWVHMTIGRIVAGLGVGILSIGVPMYQSEVCPREIRGAVVASYQLMITVGILSRSGPYVCLHSTYYMQFPTLSTLVSVTIRAKTAMPPGESSLASESASRSLLVSVYSSRQNRPDGWPVKAVGKKRACQWLVSEAWHTTPTTSWSTRTSRRWRIPSTSKRAPGKVLGWNASLASHPVSRVLHTVPSSDVLSNSSSSGLVSTTSST